MMKAAAVLCTYGRVELCEVLACLTRQTVIIPTLIYVDDAEVTFELDELPPSLVVGGMPCETLGGVRANAVYWARQLFALDDQAAILVLDDDDFYSSRHVELTLRALEHAPGGWTGGLAMGLTVDGGPVEYVCGESGVGQHATWAYTLGLYDEAGGYPEVHKDEDLGLGCAMTWKRCTPHFHCTHVRRQTRWGVSGVANFDRPRLRAQHGVYAERVRPVWTSECERLEQWCASRLPK